MKAWFRILCSVAFATFCQAVSQSSVTIKAGAAATTYPATTVLSTGFFKSDSAQGYWIIEVVSSVATTFKIYTKPSSSYNDENVRFFIAEVEKGTTLFALPAKVGILWFLPDTSTSFYFDELRLAVSKHISDYSVYPQSPRLGSGDFYVTVANTDDSKSGGFLDGVEAVRFNAQCWLPLLGSQAKIEASRFEAKSDGSFFTFPESAKVGWHSGPSLEKMESIWWRDDIVLEPPDSQGSKLIVYRLHADVNLLNNWRYGVRALSSDMRPDFVITRVTINGNKQLKSGEETLKAEVTVKNQGSEYGTPLHLHRSLPGQTPVIQGGCPFIPPGKSVKMQFETPVSYSPGTYMLDLEINPDWEPGSTVERDSSNNTYQKTFVVMGPDYTVSAIKLTPASPAPGQYFSATVTIKNIGKETGPAFIDALHFWNDRPDEPQAGDETGAETGYWSSLKAGGSVNETFDNLMAPNKPGTYTFRVYVDLNGHIDEQREDNNQKTFVYKVLGPDYIVSSIKLVPSKVLAGQPFDAEVTVKNQGKTSTCGVAANLICAYVDRPDAPEADDFSGGVMLPETSGTIPDLGPGKSQKVVFRGLAAPASPGSYTFRVYMDIFNYVAETVEDNNQKTLAYSVYQGPGIPVPTGPLGEQTETTLTYTWEAASYSTSHDLLVEYLDSATASWRTFKSLSGLKTNSTTVTGHKEGYSYRWRVRARNTYGTGTWSGPLEFMVGSSGTGLPEAPEGYDPVGTITDATPRFWWSPGSLDWTSHRLVIAQGSTVVFDLDGIEAWEYTPATPLADGDYTWYVSSINASGQGPWSEPIAFTVRTGDMVLIPSGTNSGTDPDFGPYSLTVDAFHMDRYEVTKALWDEIYYWAITNGYRFLGTPGAKGGDHPVCNVMWLDAVKWCNARSEKGGLKPCYSVEGNVYRTISGLWPSYYEITVCCDFGANGYRLPTVAEWEYAARGGQRSKRFPWGNTIDHTKANYYRIPGACYAYDQGYDGYDKRYSSGAEPYTSPAGSFAPNEYGLYDMIGNILEWCWDQSAQSNLFRNLRGGCWNYVGFNARIGFSEDVDYQGSSFNNTGFRSVCR